MSFVSTRKLLSFASVVELGTGIIVIIAPAFVVRLLVRSARDRASAAA